MKASELRIGNLLEFSNGIQPNKIIEVSRRFFSSASIEKDDGDFTVTPYYLGIKINDKWLVKFGFTKIEHRNIYVKSIYKIAGVKLKSLAVYIDGKNNKVGVVDYYTGVEKVDLLHLDYEFVHQLQNLYYALAGVEMTVS